MEARAKRARQAQVEHGGKAKRARLDEALATQPDVIDAIREGRVALVVNTTVGAKAIRDSYSIRRQSLLSNVPLVTTMPGATAFADAIAHQRKHKTTVLSLQEWHSAGDR